MHLPTGQPLLSPHGSLVSCLVREAKASNTIPLTGASSLTGAWHLGPRNTRSHRHFPPSAPLLRGKLPALSPHRPRPRRAPPGCSRQRGCRRPASMAALTSPPQGEKPAISRRPITPSPTVREPIAAFERAPCKPIAVGGVQREAGSSGRYIPAGNARGGFSSRPGSSGRRRLGVGDL